MESKGLASKKNVIILSAVVISVLLMLGSYYAKQSRLKKETLLGGQVEVVDVVPLPPPMWNFLRANWIKDAFVADLKTPLPLPTGEFMSNVRSFTFTYPLRGAMKITPMPGVGDVFGSDDAKRLYGVAVNQWFLTQSGMKLGDTFTMREKTYQLRGLIESLPDISGQEANKGPFLMLRHHVEIGNGMWDAAVQRRARYFFLTNTLSPRQFQQEFKKRFPQSTAIVSRADAQ